MPFKAYGIESQQHHTQDEVQHAAIERLVEGLDLRGKVDAIAVEFTAHVAAYTGDERSARKQAAKWAAESIAELIAAHVGYDVIFLE